MLTAETVRTSTKPKIDPVTSMSKAQFLDILSQSREDAKNGRVKDMGVALEEIRARYHL